MASLTYAAYHCGGGRSGPGGGGLATVCAGFAGKCVFRQSHKSVMNLSWLWSL